MALPVTSHQSEKANGLRKLHGAKSEKGEENVAPQSKEEKRVEKSHCKRWEEKPDYPAGIICALMEAQMDGRSESDVFIDELRDSIVAKLPEGRMWNEKSFINALERQTELGRLNRVHNTFSVQATYISEEAAAKSKKQPHAGRNEPKKSKGDDDTS